MKMRFMTLLLVLLCGIVFNVGCESDPGEMQQPTQQELENDPATKEPGTV